MNKIVVACMTVLMFATGWKAYQTTTYHREHTPQIKCKTKRSMRANIITNASFSESNPLYPGYHSRIVSRSDLPQFTRELWGRYQSRVQMKTSSTIVFRCSAFDICGGWGDRLRGIVTLFYLALVTDSYFDIVSTRHLDLATLYPLIRARRPKYKPNDTVTNLIVNDMTFLKTHDLNRHIIRQTVHTFMCNAATWNWIKLNPHVAEAVTAYNLHKLTTLDMFRVVILLYFGETSNVLYDHVKLHMNDLERHSCLKVGVQIRTGGYGLWNDPQRHPPQSGNMFGFLAVQQCTRSCALFLTTDSEVAKQVFMDHVRNFSHIERVLTTPGQPIHVDRQLQPGASYAARLKSYIDWELLRHMDTLIISRSGFGETAAWAEGLTTYRLSAKGNQSFIHFDSIVGFDASFDVGSE